MYYTIDYIYTMYYRKLNKKTKKSSYPVGSIKDNLARLYGSRCFSLLDSAGVSSQLRKFEKPMYVLLTFMYIQAFHCVPIRKSDQHKTAFGTRFGHYG